MQQQQQQQQQQVRERSRLIFLRVMIKERVR
jgi:hypothetical protein